MEAKIIFENEYATLMYHEKEKIVHHIFHQPVEGEYFRKTLLKGAELFKQMGATKWLSVDLKSSGLTKEDTEWGLSVWRPLILEAGWKYWAIVLPENIIGQIHLKNFSKIYTDEGVDVKLFTNPEKAYEWLKSVE